MGVWRETICFKLKRTPQISISAVAAFYLAVDGVPSGSELPIANCVTAITVRTRKRI